MCYVNVIGNLTQLEEDLHLSSSDDSLVISEAEEEDTTSPSPETEDTELDCNLGETILEVLSDLSIIQDLNIKGRELSAVQLVLPNTHRDLQILVKGLLK